MKSTSKILFAIIVILLSGLIASAASLDNYQLLKISAPDQRAVIKNPQGKLQVIAVGDEVDGAQVTEVAEGRVVLIGRDAETIIVRIENGKQRIETYQRLAETKPTLIAPGGKSEAVAQSAGSDTSDK